MRHKLTGNWIIELPFGPNRAFLNKGGVWRKIMDGYSISGNFTFATGNFATPSYSGTAAEIAAGRGQLAAAQPGAGTIDQGRRHAEELVQYGGVRRRQPTGDLWQRFAELDRAAGDGVGQRVALADGVDGRDAQLRGTDDGEQCAEHGAVLGREHADQLAQPSGR